ncbi:hypothetical protein [Burkholderia cepacia]|nr:hypothetical protein [Burkholderia cepacia]
MSHATPRAMSHGGQDTRASSGILQRDPPAGGDPGDLTIGTPPNVG